MLTGGCFCGQVRYEVSGAPFDESVCHCSICRRTTGAPMVAWLTVRPGAFRITAGKPTTFRSTAHCERAFCAMCGTQITFRDDRLDEIDVTTASLDEPNAVPPKAHIWTGSRLAWVKLADALPQHRDARDR
jgi:hypothetical protein